MTNRGTGETSEYRLEDEKTTSGDTGTATPEEAAANRLESDGLEGEKPASSDAGTSTPEGDAANHLDREGVDTTDDVERTSPEEAAEAAGIEVKDGAKIENLDQKVVDKFSDIADVWEKNDAPDPVITSGNDSDHKPDSLHYEDKAIDLRAKNVTDSVQDKMADELRDKLGEDFDVLSEHFDDPNNDHIHIEYDPKGADTAKDEDTTG